MRLSTLLFFALVVAYLVDPDATRTTLQSIWHRFEWGIGRDIAHSLFGNRG